MVMTSRIDVRIPSAAMANSKLRRQFSHRLQQGLGQNSCTVQHEQHNETHKKQRNAGRSFPSHRGGPSGK